MVHYEAHLPKLTIFLLSCKEDSQFWQVPLALFYSACGSGLLYHLEVTCIIDCMGLNYQVPYSQSLFHSMQILLSQLSVRKRHCHGPAVWCHCVNGPSHMVASSLHNVTLVGHHSYFLFLHHSFVDWFFYWGWQLSSRVFLAVADSIDIFSACWEYVFYL